MDQTHKFARLGVQLVPPVVFILLIVGMAAGWGLAQRKFRKMSTVDFEGRYEDLIMQLSAFRSTVAKKVQANEVDLEFDVRAIAHVDEPEEESEPEVEVVQQTRGAAGLRLTGISWDKDQPLAFVNGEILAVEDEISGFKVVKIMEKSITMRDGEGETRVLSLYD